MENKTILVADDEYGFRFPIRKFLESIGYNVMEAKNEQEVFQKVSEADFLVIDVIFPEKKEGIDIVKKIRLDQNEKIKNIPVIFFSILSDSMCIEELHGLDKRSYSWLQKPFEFTELNKAILELKRLR